jgi:la-related protein 6
MVAPALRVEVLRDEEGGLSSSYYDSADDHSHGDASDQDGGTTSPQPPEIEFVPPDEDLKERIIKQVEFYFSDVNILKDAFLLKHVRRNKQGYVSLKLITSFKKVKSMTKDYRVVAFSLKQSEKLEVNEEGTKVRRKDPLPEWDETTPSRTVVAVNLPFENPTFENVSELFSKCGEVELIRIVKPGKNIPPDVKKHVNKHPELGTTVCAVVEFSQHESAKKACETLTNSDDWRKGMRVVLLAQKKEKDKNDRKNKNKNDVQQQSVEDKDRPDSAKSGDEGKEEKRTRKKKGGRRKNSRVDELAKDGESPCYSSSSEAEGLDPSPPGRGRSQSGPVTFSRSSLSPKQDPNRLSPSTTPKSSPRNSPRSSPRTSPTMRRRNPHLGRSPLAQELSPGTSPRVSPHASPETRRRRENAKGDDSAGSSPSSPWVQRRLKAAQAEASQHGGTSPGQSPRLGHRFANLEGVVRQPRGPDGTKGFLQGVGRGKSTSECT